MPDPQPTPQPDPQPSPAPQDPAPTPDPVPTPPQPQPEPQPQGGAKGEPDDFQKLQREFGEVKEFIAGLKKAQEPAAPSEPDLDELNAKHAAEAKSWAIERELLKSGCVDTDALMVHIKADEVKLAEDGKSIAEGVDIEELKNPIRTCSLPQPQPNRRRPSRPLLALVAHLHRPKPRLSKTV